MAPKSQLDFRFSDLRIDPKSPLPKHRQVYAGLREAILDGKLKPDDVLPSSRELARELGISRNTALAAYELLLAEGYIVGRGGAGTYVALNAAKPAALAHPERVEPRPLSAMADVLRVEWPVSADIPSASMPFRPSSPAFDAFPFTTWARIVGRHTRESSRIALADGEILGYVPLRRAIAEHLQAARSCRCEPEQVFVTCGSQLGLFLCSMLLMDVDDPVWIEEPGYLEARLTFRARSKRVIPVPVDNAGLNIDAGKALSAQPRVIYVTAANQWPLGIMMPVQRRLALLQFAAETNAWIVEDDYAGDLRYDGKSYSTLQGLDEADRVIHLGTFSKTMLPGLRLGYVVVPPDLVDAFAAGRRILDRYPNTVAQAGLAEFFDRGFYYRHIHSMQQLYEERHQLLRARIASKLGGILEARPAHAGTFTVADLASGIDDVALARALHAQGIESLPLSQTYAGVKNTHGLLLGHAVAPPEAIRAGVDGIEQLLMSWGSRSLNTLTKTPATSNSGG
jgi:GntR family transcriptional regulator/MocR family aminotransferase